MFGPFEKTAVEDELAAPCKGLRSANLMLGKYAMHLWPSPILPLKQQRGSSTTQNRRHVISHSIC